MRITDYRINRCRRRRNIWCQRTTELLLLDMPVEVVVTAMQAANKEHAQVLLMMRRSRTVMTTVFNLNAFSEQECLILYRFKKHDIGRLTDMIDFSGVTDRNGYSCSPVQATCVFLHRLGAPIRLKEMEKTYGLFESQLSEVFWELVELFVNKFQYTLELRTQLIHTRAQMYAEAISEQGSPLDSVFGFIDCTKIRMCRPGGPPLNQRSVYSGHKRMHCLIYQTLSTPDGLMFALYGPEVGRRHDLTLYYNSGWDEVLEQSLFINGRQFYIYGDKAYLLRPWMQRPFILVENGSDEAWVNHEMSRVRIIVEHNYKDVKQFWITQDFARNLKVRQCPIAYLYKASAILTNFRVCLYKSGQTISRFLLDPPTLDEFLQL